MISWLADMKKVKEQDIINNIEYESEECAKILNDKLGVRREEIAGFLNNAGSISHHVGDQFHSTKINLISGFLTKMLLLPLLRLSNKFAPFHNIPELALR